MYVIKTGRYKQECIHVLISLHLSTSFKFSFFSSPLVLSLEGQIGTTLE